jgi:hypothetical protein
MNPEVKRRLSFVLGIVKTTFHIGFIPLVLYLGMTYIVTRSTEFYIRQVEFVCIFRMILRMNLIVR